MTPFIFLVSIFVIVAICSIYLLQIFLQDISSNNNSPVENTEEEKSKRLMSFIMYFSLLISEAVYSYIIYIQIQWWGSYIESGLFLWFILFVVALIAKTFVIRKSLLTQLSLSVEDPLYKKNLSLTIAYVSLCEIPWIIGLVLLFREMV